MTNVLVTGANRGLGLGFVKHYLGKNVKVVGTTRDLKSSKELLAIKERFPNNLEIFELDLLKESARSAALVMRACSNTKERMLNP